MLDDDQARAYSEADFAAPHNRFVSLFKRFFPETVAGEALDLGCGPADIVERFALAHPKCRILGVDGSPAMLRLARQRLARNPALRGRATLKLARLPIRRSLGRFPVIICNSLLHHLGDPMALWKTIRDHAAPGARIFIVDLKRARSRAHARALMNKYSRGEPAVLRHDFYHSLLAAYTPAEVRVQLRTAGLAHLCVRSISDRHIAIWGRMT